MLKIRLSFHLGSDWFGFFFCWCFPWCWRSGWMSHFPSPSLGTSRVWVFWLMPGDLAACRKSVWRLSEQFLLEDHWLISSLSRQPKDWRKLDVVFRGTAAEHYKDKFSSQRSSFARLFKAVQDVSAPWWGKTIQNWTSLEVYSKLIQDHWGSEDPCSSLTSGIWFEGRREDNFQSRLKSQHHCGYARNIVTKPRLSYSKLVTQPKNPKWEQG